MTLVPRFFADQPIKVASYSHQSPMSDELPPRKPPITMWQAVAITCAIFIAYCAVLPLFTEWSHGKFKPAYYSTAIMERAVEAFIACWFFVFGTCIGSFLNVVVYRLPRGLPVTGSSFCPQCKEPIAARDNIPIFSWLNLKAACRNCQLPISSRYPAVELLVGTAFLTLAIVELLWGGINLPLSFLPRFGFGWNITQTQFPLVVIFGCHAATMAALIAQALIDRDQQRIPKRIAMFVGSIVGICVIIWPQMHFLGEPPAGVSNAVWSVIQLLSSLAIGSAAGFGLLAVVRMITPESASTSRNDLCNNFAIAIILTVTLISVCCGWQALAAFFICCCYVELFWILRRSITHNSGPLISTSLAAASFLFLCTWGWLADALPTLSLPSRMIMLIATVIAAGVIAGFRLRQTTNHSQAGQ